MPLRIYNFLKRSSRRTLADAPLEAIHRALRDADEFVLNGDISDFRRSTAGGDEATCRKALAWLADLTERAPECQFRYVLGNHDNETTFADALDAFARARNNLTWHFFHVRVGTGDSGSSDALIASGWARVLSALLLGAALGLCGAGHSCVS